MAAEEIVDGLATRLQAQIGQQIVARRDPANAFTGVAGGQKDGAAARRGAGVAELFVSQALQQQRLQVHATEQALPMTAKFAVALARDVIEARPAAAIIAYAIGKIVGLQSEVVVPLSAPQGRDQPAMRGIAVTHDSGAHSAVDLRHAARRRQQAIAIAG